MGTLDYLYAKLKMDPEYRKYYKSLDDMERWDVQIQHMHDDIYRTMPKEEKDRLWKRAQRQSRWDELHQYNLNNPQGIRLARPCSLSVMSCRSVR